MTFPYFTSSSYISNSSSLKSSGSWCSYRDTTFFKTKHLVALSSIICLKISSFSWMLIPFSWCCWSSSSSVGGYNFFTYSMLEPTLRPIIELKAFLVSYSLSKSTLAWPENWFKSSLSLISSTPTTFPKQSHVSLISFSVASTGKLLMRSLWLYFMLLACYYRSLLWSNACWTKLPEVDGFAPALFAPGLLGLKSGSPQSSYCGVGMIPVAFLGLPTFR